MNKNKDFNVELNKDSKKNNRKDGMKKYLLIGTMLLMASCSNNKESTV